MRCGQIGMTCRCVAMPYPQFQMLCRKIIAICIARRASHRKRRSHHHDRFEHLMFPEHRGLFSAAILKLRKTMALFTTDTAANARSRFFDYKAVGRDQCRLRPLNITMRNSQASAKEKRISSRAWSPSDYSIETDRQGRSVKRVVPAALRMAGHAITSPFI